jgi:hypothetical protein
MDSTTQPPNSGDGAPAPEDKTIDRRRFLEIGSMLLAPFLETVWNVSTVVGHVKISPFISSDLADSTMGSLAKQHLEHCDPGFSNSVSGNWVSNDRLVYSTASGGSWQKPAQKATGQADDTKS